MRKLLCGYGADAGSFVINGIGISNGIGDGEYNVFYTSKLPKGAKLVEELWIDLRNEYPIVLHTHDCNVCGEEMYPNKVIKPNEFRKYFGKAQALQVAYDYGTIYLVKYF